MPTTPVPDPQTSVGFDTVHRHELRQLARRRHLALDAPDVSTEIADTDDPVEVAHRLKPFGLSFSGGGIRSATFNLGVLQGLAQMGLLTRVDYLSTVSGGGYIGSWLHGFIRTHCQGQIEDATRQLADFDRAPRPPSQDPVAFLRKYSNYLAPKSGLFSADAWVIGAIWLRNVLLNQLILLPALAAAVLLTWGAVFLQATPHTGIDDATFGMGAGALAVALLVVAWLVTKKAMGDTVAPGAARTRPGGLMPSWFWSGPGLVPFTFAAAVVLGTVSVLPAGRRDDWRWLAAIVALKLLMYGAVQRMGGFPERYRANHPAVGAWRPRLHLVWIPLLTAGLNLALLRWLWTSADAWPPQVRITIGPPLACATILASAAFQIGLMGPDFPESAREWVSRIISLLAMAAVAWLVLFGIALWGPFLVAYMLGTWGKTTMALITAWAATTGAGVVAGRNAQTGQTNPKSRLGVTSVVMAAAPTLFMLGYLLLVALGMHAAIVRIAGVTSPAPAPAAQTGVRVDVRVPPSATPIEVNVTPSSEPSRLDAMFVGAAGFAEHFHDVIAAAGQRAEAPARLREVGLLLLGCCMLAWAASLRVNVNEFSLHHFYKNRLVRCYLGASHGDRRLPNPLTGFDPTDDIPLSALRPDADGHPYPGPYPIMNAALNLNAGSELAQQERKATSFVFTPDYCGFSPGGSTAARPAGRDAFDDEGYRRTFGAEFGYSAPDGPTVGTAMAISGAAANPNWGTATSGPMAFLLTVFNARLGWWLGNPRWRGPSKQPGPSFALWYLLSELAASTTARTKFVNLSDGGHFENLGLYELVRRRCRYIVVCDAEQDGDLTFGSLGGAIRKCRADFGVEINIDPTPIRMDGALSRAHCVMGTITYPEADSTTPVAMTGNNLASLAPDGCDQVEADQTHARGWLLYLKSSVTGNEPADVLQYRAEHPEFPHQTTGDQFFSESQFESYRRLGLHVVREAFEGARAAGAVVPADRPGGAFDLTDLFQRLTVAWYPRNPISAEAASRLNDAYAAFVSTLGAKTELETLVPAVLATLDGEPQFDLFTPKAHHLTLAVQQLQIMENVFFEFGFEHAANRANPRNRGWMTVFRQWGAKKSLLVAFVWPRVRHSYNPVFQHFVDSLADAPIDDVPRQL